MQRGQTPTDFGKKKKCLKKNADTEDVPRVVAHDTVQECLWCTACRS